MVFNQLVFICNERMVMRFNFYVCRQEMDGDGMVSGSQWAGSDEWDAEGDSTVLTDEPSIDEEELSTQTQKMGTPEAYELMLPEGFKETDSAALESFMPIAQEVGLSNEQAQKLVDLYGQNIQAQAKVQEAAWVNQRAAWIKELKNDAEFGAGDEETFRLNVGRAQMALSEFGSPELKSFLQQSGMGDSAPLVRFFCKVGQALGEDGLVQSNFGGKRKSAAEILFDGK